MGMVMYVRGCGQAESAELAAGGDMEVIDWIVGGGWEADKMWWAVLDLLLGPGGVERLQGSPITDEQGYTAVIRVEPSQVAALAHSMDGLKLADLESRFEADAFGDPMGPEVTPQDRDWLPKAAEALRTLIVDAANRGDEILWVVT